MVGYRGLSVNTEEVFGLGLAAFGGGARQDVPHTLGMPIAEASATLYSGYAAHSESGAEAPGQPAAWQALREGRDLQDPIAEVTNIPGESLRGGRQ